MKTGELSDKAIFGIARRLDSEDAIREYLRQVCGVDVEREDRILELLRTDNADSFLEDSPIEAPQTTDAPTRPQSVGRTIGPYKLREQIGEGGMGTVFIAEQERPVKRAVALKLIKPGMDSKQVIARFEAERQSLAMMDHPNIAKVLDAGTTEQGQPYFVMELVKGTPITQYCDENRLSAEDRVGLMIDVCHAVQHAHQKGIIHRDLKPSNILVAQYDDKPVPKVIDFGVAKAMHQKLTEKTIYTQMGQIVGTLEYMSPEQAVLNQLDVDTRSDVYSLGVVLYELLVGETPLDGNKLRSQSLDEMIKTIREAQPQRPSIRLSSQGEAATQTAAYRHTDTSTLSKTLRGDLDWVVMKAIEKDRARRYESASRFAEDLNHYLTGDVVEARPPSTAYRLHKAWQHSKGLITATGAVVLSLTIGLLVSTFWWQNAVAARDEMADARDKMQQARDEFATTLKSLQDRIIEQALLSAISGETQNTRRLINDATKAKVDEDMLLTLQGVADYWAGRDAYDSLEAAVSKNPNNWIARNMLAIAVLHDGDWSRNMQLVSGIQKMNFDWEQQPHIEQMFGAYALEDADPPRSIEVLRRLVREHPSWLAARIHLAGCLTWNGMKSQDNKLVEEAIRQANAIELLGTDSRNGKAICLYVYTFALSRGVEGPDTTRIERRADELFAELENERSWNFVTMVRAWYLDRCKSDPAKAVEIYESTAADQRPHDWPYEIAAVSFGISADATSKAINLLEMSPASLPAVGATALLRAPSGEAPESETRQIPNSQLAVVHCWAQAIAGDVPRAQEIARDYLARDYGTEFERRHPGEVEYACLRFFREAGIGETYAGIEYDETSMFEATMVYFTLAAHRIGNRDFGRAKGLLENASSTGVHSMYTLRLARSILERWGEVKTVLGASSETLPR